MTLTEWRDLVAGWVDTQFATIGGRPVTVYDWPTLKPEAPAIVLFPGGPRGVLVDFDAAQVSFDYPGVIEARLMVLLDAVWDHQAFDELDTIAQTLVGGRPPFHIARINQPGIVDDLPNRTLIGMAVDIASFEPIQ